MKKLLALLLATCMSLSLVACGGGDKPAASTPAVSTPAASAPAEVEWPTKAINFVCPWSAGGDTDFNARALAQYLEKELGVTVNVVNTTGGGGSVASTEVKDTDPDGYTFLFFDSAIALNQASGVTDFGYEAFDPVCIVGKSCGEFLVTQADAPYNTVAEMIEYTKAHPGEVIMAANTGATSYYAATKLSEQGADLNIVNSGSSSERVIALIGRQINLSVNAYGVVSQYLQTGELKLLGNLASERPDAYADIPTALEQDVDCSYDVVYNILAPKGTDPAIVEALNNACQKVVESNADYAKDIYTAYGQMPYFLDTEETVDFMKEESDKYMAYADIFQSASK